MKEIISYCFDTEFSYVLYEEDCEFTYLEWDCGTPTTLDNEFAVRTYEFTQEQVYNSNYDDMVEFGFNNCTLSHMMSEEDINELSNYYYNLR